MKRLSLSFVLLSICLLGSTQIKDSEQKIKKQIITSSQINKPKTNLPSENVYEAISLSDWISITASIATLITAILTYLLLRETQKTLKLSVNVFEREEKRSEAETMNLLHHNFRDTYGAMLNDTDTLKVLAKADKISTSEVKINFYSSFLINNANQLFIYRQRNFVSDTEWNNLISDIIVFFEYPFIKKRWQVIKKYYPDDFTKFIEDTVYSKT